MAFTKITAAGIGSTETVTLDGVSVINNESIGGNLTVTGNATIGGVLTYEDVTNVDSVGLITARNGVVVGSGITLSKDGDIFFTGIATGNGSGLTALNASNLASGTVPTARLGSGTASSSTFLAGDSTFKTVTGTTINANADNRVITGSDTANTLNGESGLTYDGSTLKIDGGLIEIAHTSCHLDFMETSTTNHRLRNGSGNFQIQKISDDKNTTTTQFLVDGGTGAVELYHNGTKQCETSASGLAFPAGKGIDFSAASGSASGSTSALLDDYEEGTYNPFITQGMDPDISSNAGAYTYLKGYYRKVGTLVEFNFYIQITNNSSYEGDGASVKIALPFTQDDSNQKRGWGLLTYQTMQGINVGANGIHIQVNSSAAEFYSGATAVTMGNGDSQANRYIIGGGVYHST